MDGLMGEEIIGRGNSTVNVGVSLIMMVKVAGEPYLKGSLNMDGKGIFF